MEKRREQGGVLGSVAELFDLPADVVAGLPRLELVGNRELYLEGHTGLLRYSDTGIDANTGFGVLRVSGRSQAAPGFFAALSSAQRHKNSACRVGTDAVRFQVMPRDLPGAGGPY